MFSCGVRLPKYVELRNPAIVCFYWFLFSAVVIFILVWASVVHEWRRNASLARYIEEHVTLLAAAIVLLQLPGRLTTFFTVSVLGRLYAIYREAILEVLEVGDDFESLDSVSSSPGSRIASACSSPERVRGRVIAARGLSPKAALQKAHDEAMRNAEAPIEREEASSLFERLPSGASRPPTEAAERTFLGQLTALSTNCACTQSQVEILQSELLALRSEADGTKLVANWSASECASLVAEFRKERQARSFPPAEHQPLIKSGPTLGAPALNGSLCRRPLGSCGDASASPGAEERMFKSVAMSLGARPCDLLLEDFPVMINSDDLPSTDDGTPPSKRLFDHNGDETTTEPSSTEHSFNGHGSGQEVSCWRGQEAFGSQQLPLVLPPPSPDVSPTSKAERHYLRERLQLSKVKDLRCRVDEGLAPVALPLPPSHLSLATRHSSAPPTSPGKRFAKQDLPVQTGRWLEYPELRRQDPPVPVYLEPRPMRGTDGRSRSAPPGQGHCSHSYNDGCYSPQSRQHGIFGLDCCLTRNR